MSLGMFPALAQSSWKTVAPSNVARIEAQSVVMNGKMYVFAGFYKAWSVTQATEVYDPIANKWSMLAPMPQLLTHQGIAVADKTVWLVGGFKSGRPKIPQKVAYIYNLENNTWTQGPSLPVVRSSLAMARLGRKLHVFGGLLPDMETSTGEHYVLDLDNQRTGWTLAAPLPFPRNHLSAAVVGGKIYAIGGQTGHDIGRSFLKYVHAYDPLTETWTRVADLPTARSHYESGTTVHDGKIIITGGVGPGGNLNKVTEYDPQTNTWTELPPLAHTMLAPNTKVINGQLIVANGLYGDAIKTTRVRPVAGNAADKLGFWPKMVSLNLSAGSAKSTTAYLWTLNKEASYTINTSTLPGWLTVSGASGSTDPSANEVRISMNAAGLQPGKYTATLTATASGYASVNLPVQLEVTGTTTANQILYRINPGGSALAASPIPWSASTANPSPYLTNGQNKVSRTFTGTNTTGAPNALFNTYRWDPGKAGDPLSSEMRWAFPVSASGTYQVKLFFAETYSGTMAPGKRVFDVVIEGNKVLSRYDIYAEAGKNATVKTFTVSVSDGQLNINFLHVVENPQINGIEITALSSGGDNCVASGTILREHWANVSGTSVSSIPIASAPTSTSQLSAFEGPSNTANNYGSRISGYICPPQSGNYTFWIAGDDHCELWLSTTDSPANKVKIASISGYTSYRQWNKYATQQSAPVALVAGRRYYVETLHKEAYGSDHVSVGWQLPNGTQERPIPGNRLSPFDRATATSSSSSSGSISEADGKLIQTVYPNPFRDQLKITLAGASDAELEVTLFDQTGRKVYSAKHQPTGAHAEIELDLSDLSLRAGIYLLRISDGSNYHKATKVYRH